MKKTVVLFNLEQNGYFNHKTNLISNNHTEATKYPDKSFALRILYDNQAAFKSNGFLNWETRTIITLN